MAEADYTYGIEWLEPELAAELDEVRCRYVERTGRPGFRLHGSVMRDLDEAVERCRALHAEGHHVALTVRFLR